MFKKYGNVSAMELDEFASEYAAHTTDMLKNSDESIGYSTPNSIVNGLFYRVFSIETILVNKTNLPFGASIVAVCRKT